MKQGGEIIYAGALGHHSKTVIEYFEVENQVLIPCSFGYVRVQMICCFRDQSLQGSLCNSALL